MSSTISRKTLRLTLLLLLVFAGRGEAADLAQIRDRGVLEVAARPISTLIYSPGNSEFPGFCYELARAFARSLDVEIAVQPVDSFSAYWERGEDRAHLSLFEDVDMYAEILTVNEERKDLLFLTPYIESTEILVGRAESEATDLRDLAGKRVAVVEGMSFQPVLEEALSEQGVGFRRVPAALEDGMIVARETGDNSVAHTDAEASVELLLLPPGMRTTLMFFPEQLALGAIDFFVLDSFSLFHQLNVSHTLRGMVRPLFPLSESVGELAFGSSFDATELNSALDRWMVAFRSTAEYDSLVERYIGMSYERYIDFIEDFPE
ncbi:MAG: transporter substrate-binding domain-containing protein [Spirochaetaceae bacterium]